MLLLAYKDLKGLEMLAYTIEINVIVDDDGSLEAFTGTHSSYMDKLDSSQKKKLLNSIAIIENELVNATNKINKKVKRCDQN